MSKADKNTKTYTVDGVQYLFSNEQLYQSIKHKQNEIIKPDEKKMSQAKIQKALADEVNVSPDTVKSWVYGNNSPFDLDQVKAVADFFGIDYRELLVKKEEKTMMEADSYMAIATEKQRIITKDRVREVYEALADAIDIAWEFFFTEFYRSFDEKEADEYFLQRYNTEYEEAERVCQKVDFLLLKYQLDIPTSLQTNISRLKWSLAEGVVQETCSLISDLMDDELKNEAKTGIDRLFRKIEGYCAIRQAKAILHDVFSDYIVAE